MLVHALTVFRLSWAAKSVLGVQLSAVRARFSVTAKRAASDRGVTGRDRSCEPLARCARDQRGRFARRPVQAERQDDTAGLADLFPGMGQGLAEWIVTAPGGEQTVLQMAYFDRSRAPVVMEIGPVARMLDRYSPAELVGLAGRLDPGLTARDFADAEMQLDRIADEEFFRYGLSQQDIAALRGRFAAWPRTPQAVTPEIPASGLRHPDTVPEHLPGPQRDAPELGQ